MTALVVHVARPITLWALHFIAIYALISAACAPRALLDVQVMRAVAGLVTLGAGLLVLIWLFAGSRRLRHCAASAPERPLATAAVWSATISALAILLNLWPVAILAGCSG